MKTMEELLMVTETAMVRGCLKTATMSAPAPSSPMVFLMLGTGKLLQMQYLAVEDSSAPPPGTT